ncbi:polyprotein [Striga asiatica]|uniref:Polyprotein n=1 Tax=Striga asiatica TaxID=4170 RepID=A0A5A7P7U7_STRAF|nr:polyprotein [Striga asiatica]
MTKKCGIKWTEVSKEAFEKLRCAMTTMPVLAMPKFDVLFEVHTDTSNIGIREVLIMEGRPFAYISKALGSMIVTPKQQKFVSKLMRFDFEIVYWPGRQNAVVDALSRRTDVAELEANSGSTWALWDDLRDAQNRDTFCQDVRRKMEAKDAAAAEYDNHDGLLLYRGKVYVLNESKVKYEITWRNITMDFIEGLPMSNKFNGVMVMVDRLTQYAHFVPLTHPYTKWEDFLPWAEYWYNTVYHSSTKSTLFELLYGCKPPTLMSNSMGILVNDEDDACGNDTHRQTANEAGACGHASTCEDTCENGRRLEPRENVARIEDARTRIEHGG